MHSHKDGEAMRDLKEIRQELDVLDRQMVELYKRRIRLCEDVAKVKIAADKPILDREREAEKLEELRKLAETDFDKNAVEELYKQIMAISRRYQYAYINRKPQNKSGFSKVKEICEDPINYKVVYQGGKGAYQEVAARKFFESRIRADSGNIGMEIFHAPTFDSAIRCVTKKEADFAVIPIENSSAGQVGDTYDLLSKRDVFIVGEVLLPIRHALLGIKGAKIEDIRTVISHPQALMQCREYLKKKDWVEISHQNTALSAMKIRDDKEKSQAAIAGIGAAKIYNLDILEENINDVDVNTTRFVILSGRKIYREDAEKTSIMFTVLHKQGSLYDVLGNMMFNGLNMLKIESRPIKEREWEYRFFVDIEGNLEDPGVMNALDAIKAEVGEFKILGCY